MAERTARDIIPLFTAAISTIGQLEERLRTQQRGSFDTVPAHECGTFLLATSKNGGLAGLDSDNRTRVRHAASQIGRGYRSDTAVRQLMSEIGTDLQKLCNVNTHARARAKKFIAGVVGDYTGNPSL